MKTILPLICILSSLLLTACGDSDPYQGKPVLTTLDPNTTAKPTLPEPEPVGSVLGMDFPDFMTFREGEQGEYPVSASLDGVGTLEVLFQKMPPGMTYQKVEGKLVWEPTFQDGDDPTGNPPAGYRVYVLEVVVRVQEAPVNSLMKQIPIIVQNAQPE